MPCCWTAVVLPQSPSAKVRGMLQRDRCSEARVRLRLFSELGRADSALRKAVDWPFRFALAAVVRPKVLFDGINAWFVARQYVSRLKNCVEKG